MHLVYVERATAGTDVRLRHLLEARAAAAEACVKANQKAAEIRRDLTQHIARRLQEGASAAVLRKALVDSGINQTMASDVMRAAGAGIILARRVDPDQPELFDGS